MIVAAQSERLASSVAASVLSRSDLLHGEEPSIEVREIVEAGVETDGKNGIVSVDEEVAGVTDAQFSEVVGKGRSGRAFEEAAEARWSEAE